MEHASGLVNSEARFLTFATGQGKTTVLLVPSVAAKMRGESGIVILIVSRKALAEQRVSEEYL